MAIKFETFKTEPRKLKGSTDANPKFRPAYEYQGAVRDSVRTDSVENLVADLLEVSGNDLGKIADFVVEGFNSLAEKNANPSKDLFIKVIMQNAIADGKPVTFERAQEIKKLVLAQL
jgi:hypothetical protein